MINRVILVGRLTKDPMLRKTQTGTSVTSFTVACGRRVAAGQEPQTDFINCVAWNRTADIVSQYTHKGSLVGVEGRIQSRSYDDAQGKRVYVTEVVCDSVQFLESRSASENRGSMMETRGYESDVPSYDDFASTPSLDISSDDLPF
ncbi:MAG: single-stranded DNA-binding protein [Erysipelotrichaceae bacterium]|jgi:single-strand DNA-binding protein|nr:single-stranded DNA-binding protein [Erysipelotrichaceae bacterium]MBR5796253.1 single-stranded DNA-binding protein [Erysipelotrichaceae bacterium]